MAFVPILARTRPKAWGLAIGLMIACACGGASSEEITMPSGDPGWRITCAKTEDSADCVKEAHARCPQGYDRGRSSEAYVPNAPGMGGQMIEQWTIVCR